MAKKTPKPVPPGMVRCPECVDGWRDVDEPGYGSIRDACYHCGNTGFITDEHARQDRISRIADMLGHRAMEAIREARNNNPDGEDFAFCAAENMCSEYEYSLGVASDYAMRMLRVFEEMDKKERLLLDVLMDAIDPPAKPTVEPDDSNYGDRQEDYDPADPSIVTHVIEPTPPPPDNGEIARLAELLDPAPPPPKRDYSDDDIPF